MLGSPSLAEDVTQECFLALMRKPELYRGDRATLRTYLCSAARHMALRQIRRRARETGMEELDGDCGASGDGEPLGLAMQGEAIDAVRQAVASLPPLQREALILAEYEEMSLAEIASVAGTDIGTIKSRLHRARERLRRILAPWLGAEPKAAVTVGKETP